MFKIIQINEHESCLSRAAVLLNLKFQIPQCLIHSCTVVDSGQCIGHGRCLQLAVHLTDFLVGLQPVDCLFQIPEQKPVNRQVILSQHIALNGTMPVVLHLYICNQKAGHLSILNKRNSHKRTDIIHAKVTDHILVLRKALLNLRYGKALGVLPHSPLDPFQVLIGNIPKGIIVEYRRLLMMITHVKRSVQSKVIGKGVNRIPNQFRDIPVINIDQILPGRDKVHLLANQLIVPRNGFLLDQCFDILLSDTAVHPNFFHIHL